MAIVNFGPIAIHDQGVHVSTKAYQRLARVSHPTTGARYLAYRFDVPAGIELTNASYWRFEDGGIALLQSQIDDNASSIANMAIERGSNVHGEWVKLPDGTLLQYAKNKLYGNVTTNLSRLASVAISFPMAFVGEYGATVDCSMYGNAYGSVSRVYSHTPTYCRADFHLAVGTSVVAGNLRGGFIAIGSWK